MANRNSRGKRAYKVERAKDIVRKELITEKLREDLLNVFRNAAETGTNKTVRIIEDEVRITLSYGRLCEVEGKYYTSDNLNDWEAHDLKIINQTSRKDNHRTEKYEVYKDGELVASY